MVSDWHCGVMGWCQIDYGWYQIGTGVMGWCQIGTVVLWGGVRLTMGGIRLALVLWSGVRLTLVLDGVAHGVIGVLWALLLMCESYFQLHFSMSTFSFNVAILEADIHSMCGDVIDVINLIGGKVRSHHCPYMVMTTCTA